MEHIKERLERLLRKEEWSIEERQWMLRYLNGGDLSELRLIALEQYHNDLAVVKNRIEKRLSKEMLRKIHDRIPGRKRPVFRLPLKAAAAAAMIILGVSLWIYYQHISVSPVSYKEASTQKGERKEIRLADGTKVWLSPASRLEYPDKFGDKTRKVSLSGEAFFEVAEDKLHPFIIRTGSLETKVLGTSFTISAYRKRDHIAVTVLSGKVSVSALSNDRIETLASIEITQHEKALFNKTDRSLVKAADPDAARMLSRRDGLLIYNGTPLAAVAEDLSVHFNTVIKLEGNITACGYYGNFNAKDNLEDVLRQLCLTINGTLHKIKGGYMVSGEGC